MSKETTLSCFREGIAYSWVPRDYETENRKCDGTHGRFDLMEQNGAVVQSRTQRVNRKDIFPDSEERDFTEMFDHDYGIIDQIPLAGGSHAAVISPTGTVTGPYVAGENEYHGLQLISRDRVKVPTFGELTEDEMQRNHQILNKNMADLDRVVDCGGRSFIGYSFSEYELLRRIKLTLNQGQAPVEVLFSRPPVQNVGTIHGHVVYIQPDLLKDTPRSQESNIDKRMANEPHIAQLVELVRERVVMPTLEKYPDLPVEYAEHTENDNWYPKGLFFIVPNSALEGRDLARFVKEIHSTWYKEYEKIAGTLVDYEKLKTGNVKMFPKEERITRIEALLSTSEYSGLSDRTKWFIRLLGRLKDPREVLDPSMTIREASEKIKSFVLIGPAYNMVYYRLPSDPEKTVIAVIPRWISAASSLESLGIFKDQQAATTQEFSPIAKRFTNISRTLFEGLSLSSKSNLLEVMEGTASGASKSYEPSG